MKYLRFPIGHPKVYQGDKCPPITEIFGIVNCKLLPPDNLNYPLIPTTINGRLMFVLCPKCAAEQSDLSCSHSDEERSITGTFCSTEVVAALRFGYKLLAIHECWHYEQTAKLGQNEDGLWSDYINSMLKCKQEASGWPKEDMTEDEKLQYICEYLQNEGIQLDYDKIEKNECRRTLNKLLLNSLWGKFAQRQNMVQSRILQEPEDLLKMLVAPNVRVKSIVDTLGSKIMVNFVNDEEANYSSNTTNVVIAAMTTSHARLMLYQLMHTLDKNLCYFDTDSVVFFEPKDQPILKTGSFLGKKNQIIHFIFLTIMQSTGELTDEIADFGAGATISKFVSIGPKSYCLEVKVPGKEPFTITKMKGVTLKHNNKHLTDFKTMKGLVDGELDDVTIQIVNRIERGNDFKIFTRADSTKKVQLVYTKRARVGPYETKPWGLRENSKPVVPDTRYVIEDWSVRSYVN
jgi:hypothetical protein